MRWRLSIAVVLAGVLLSGARAAAERSWKDWRALEKRVEAAFAPDSEESVATKRALAVEAAIDSKPRRAGKLLIALAETAVEREAEVREDAADIVEDLADDDGDWSNVVYQELRGLRARAAAARADALALADAMARGPPALRQRLFGAAAKRRDGRLHRVALHTAAHHPRDKAARSFVLAALVGAEDSRLRLMALRALATNPEAWSAWIADRVADEHWTVQIAAAHISARHGLGESIGELIKWLSCSAPRVQHAFVGALHTLTGESLGLDPAGWKRWWRRNHMRYGAKARSAQGPMCVDARFVPFYDLEIHTNRVLFLIDVSDSMENRAVASVKPNGERVYADKSRMELVKEQLERSVRALQDGYRFNLVAFGDEVDPWQEEMAVVDERTRRDAVRWIRKLEPDGATHMNRALHWVFGRMGFGDGTVAPIEADTLVVLSDGAPTDGWPAGRGAKGREAVLEEVRDWNRDHALVIHAVAIRGADIEFLEILSTENGGQVSIR